jgi:hypothetical protein
MKPAPVPLIAPRVLEALNSLTERNQFQIPPDLVVKTQAFDIVGYFITIQTIRCCTNVME